MEDIEPTSPCPVCETPLHVLSQQVGRGLQCPYCQTSLTLEVGVDQQPEFHMVDSPLTPPPKNPLPPMTPVQTHPGPPQNQLAPNQYAKACYNCGSTRPLVVRHQMGNTGVIVMIIMLLVCFPFFWIGFLIKETSYSCPECGVRRG